MPPGHFSPAWRLFFADIRRHVRWQKYGGRFRDWRRRLTGPKSSVSGAGPSPRRRPEGWWVGVQIEDSSVWQKIKSGKYAAFSLHGRGSRMLSKRKYFVGQDAYLEPTPVVNVSLDELSIVDFGDDEEAKILLMKRASSQTTPREQEKIMTRNSAYGAIKARAAELEAQGLEPAKALAQAMDESPSVVKAYRQSRDVPTEPDEVVDPYARAAARQRERMRKAEGPTAYAEFQALLDTIAKENSSLTPRQVFITAVERRRDLYARAREEQFLH
jgi:hypothetical protein